MYIIMYVAATWMFAENGQGSLIAQDQQALALEPGRGEKEFFFTRARGLVPRLSKLLHWGGFPGNHSRYAPGDCMVPMTDT